MVEALRKEYVGQRQYGVIAPDRDVNAVYSLITSGMFPCFGVAVFDTQSNVGMFTHLDNAEDLTHIFERSYPVLDSLGANRFSVATVNIDSPHLMPYGRQTIVDSRRKELDKLVEDLIRRHSFAGQEWLDSGVSTCAIFEPRLGISPVTIWQLGHTESVEWISARVIQTLNRLDKTKLIPISCAYAPEVK